MKKKTASKTTKALRKIDKKLRAKQNELVDIGRLISRKGRADSMKRGYFEESVKCELTIKYMLRIEAVLKGDFNIYSKLTQLECMKKSVEDYLLGELKTPYTTPPWEVNSTAPCHQRFAIIEVGIYRQSRFELMRTINCLKGVSVRESEGANEEENS